MGNKVRFIHQDCDPSLAQDRSLPHTACLVEYVEGDINKFDIVMANKRVDIFDHYWDKYRDVRGIKWTDGKVNPKMWGYVPNEKKKKK